MTPEATENGDRSGGPQSAPAAARAAGIAVIYQELTLFPELRTAVNKAWS
jgi:ABC-type sugar transport system ATPase subunit